jgi:hypothetical protein
MHSVPFATDWYWMYCPASRDYASGIKVDVEDFETVVHELRSYFGFLSLNTHVNLSFVFTCNGATNYLVLLNWRITR